AVGGAPRIAGTAAVALVRAGDVDARAVLGLVLVDDAVPPVVPGLAHPPCEDAPSIHGIGNPRVFILAVQREDVVARDRSPVDVAVADARPALDAREQPFDPRPVAMDDVAGRRRGIGEPPAAG